MRWILLIIVVLMLASCSEKADIEEQDLSEFAVAYFAGGCFWCVESDFEKLNGVIEAVSGYAGGEISDPSYREVSSGKTGHRETVAVYYDPDVISYGELVNHFWFVHDPTDGTGSFYDRGLQYTSAIFYSNDDERIIAEKSKEDIDFQGVFIDSISTMILPFGEFFEAEDYHQDYYEKNPIRYNYYRSGSGRDRFIEGLK